MKFYKQVLIAEKPIRLSFKLDQEEITVQACWNQLCSNASESLNGYKNRQRAIVHVLHIAEKRAVQKLMDVDEIENTYWAYNYDLDVYVDEAFK